MIEARRSMPSTKLMCWMSVTLTSVSSLEMTPQWRLERQPKAALLQHTIHRNVCR